MLQSLNHWSGSSSTGVYQFALARFDDDGVLDENNFSGDGLLTTDFGLGANSAYAVAFDASHRIVVAGYAAADGIAFLHLPAGKGLVGRWTVDRYTRR